MLTLWTVVLVVLALGAFAGILAGLLGVGGGIVLVPAFFYLFRYAGYDGPDLMHVCLGTSLATIVITSLRSLQAHSKRGAVDWQVLRGWGPFIVLGALIGTATVSALETRVLQLLFGVLAILIAVYLGLGSSAWRLKDDLPDGVSRNLWGASIGGLSVLMGIGGGSFGVPVLALHGMTIHKAVATAAGFGLAIAAPAVALLLFLPVQQTPDWTVGAVNLPVFFLVICATLVTTPIGAAMAHTLPADKLRRIFAIFLAIVAINMLAESIYT